MRHASLAEAVDAVLAHDRRLVLATPLGLGKPNRLVNALYDHCTAHAERALHLYTALSLDPPGLADYLGLWDKYRTRWQTSVTYVARMVMLESDLAVREAGLVTARDMRHGTEAEPSS